MITDFNPIWTGLFENLKRLRAKCPLPPILAISSQMTMKLGRAICTIKIFMGAGVVDVVGVTVKDA